MKVEAKKTVPKPEWMARVCEAMRDDFVKAQVARSEARIASILAEAKAKGCTDFACTLGPPSQTVQLLFQNPETGYQIRRSLSFRRALAEHKGTRAIPFDLGIKCSIQNKILNTEGIEPKRRLSRRRSK